MKLIIFTVLVLGIGTAMAAGIKIKNPFADVGIAYLATTYVWSVDKGSPLGSYDWCLSRAKLDKEGFPISIDGTREVQNACAVVLLGSEY